MTYRQWLREFGRFRSTLIWYAVLVTHALHSAIKGDVTGAVVFLAAVPVSLAIHLLVAWDIFRHARRYHESIGAAPPAAE